MRLSRRRFLRTSALGAGALMLPGGIDSALAAIARGASATAPGFGPLRRDPRGLLDLPAGFQYRMFSAGSEDDAPRFNSKLSDGSPTPALHDGMAAFPGPGGVTILVRNHEMNVGDSRGVDPKRERPYDPATTGGTTTLWVDRERNLVRSFGSLSGTLRNCAGGATPWGSWLTAEEAVDTPGARDPVNSDPTPRVRERHGYVFEVDSRAEGLVNPVPLKAMGRFRHEAVAVDPATGFAYLTEDRDDGLLYRFRPTVVERGTAPSALRVGDYAKGGVLEALRVKSRPQLTTNNHGRRAIALGESLEVDWVRIENVDPDMDMARGAAGDQTAPTSTRAQGFGGGAARFARSEGIVHHDGSIYFCATNGGAKELGQVFRIRLREQRLSLMVESAGVAVLDGPDNISVSPFGDLVVCEDSGEREPFVVGITPQGRCYRIARNAHPAEKELAGACFSPDGSTLFVNVQRPGMTFAIWGPWSQRRA